MLTGRQAFEGELVTEVLASVLAREPDYAALRSDLHPKLDALLRRCLEKDPKRRWHDAGDVRVEIEQILSDREGSIVRTLPTAQPAGLRAVLPWALASLVVGGIVFGGAAWFLKPEPVTDGVVRFFHPLEEEDFTRSGRPLVDISRDGTQLAYVADQQIWLRRLDEDEAHPIVGTDEDPSTPVFSPDGEYVAFWSSDEELKRIPVSGGTSVTIAPAGNPFGVTWEDNDSIIYGATDGIWRVPAFGGTPEQIVSISDSEAVHDPRILPGGTHILYSLSEGTDWDLAEIIVEDLTTHEKKTVWTGNDARYSPTGHLVYAFEGDLFALRFNLETLSVEGGPVSMVRGAQRGRLNTGTAHYALSDGGTLVWVPGSSSGGRLGEEVLAFMDRGG